MKGPFNLRFFFAFAGIVVVLAVHGINYSFSGHFFHSTADDPSYLRPAENFLTTGAWKENFTGPSAFVQRPPLMGVQHGIFYWISPENAELFSFLLALFLHATAIFLLFGCLLEKFRKRTAVVLIGLYIILPVFWGFLSYQITEVFAVSLVTIFISLLISRKRNLVLWLAILLFLWLFRPVLILIFLPTIVPLLQEKRKSSTSIIVYGLTIILLVSTAFWEIRKHSYMQNWLDPHPIYSAYNQTMFRPAHERLSNLFRIWEVKPENLHAISGSLWSGSDQFLDIETLKIYISENHCPATPEKLRDILYGYQQASVNAQTEFNTNSGTTELEQKFIQKCDRFAAGLRRENRFQNLFSTPARSAKALLTKSQLNLEIFQSYWRGNIFVELFRLFCLAWIVLGFVCTIAGVFLKSEFRWMAVGVVLYCWYLFFMQRMNEERYFVVVLPIFLLFYGQVSQWITDKRLKK